MVHQEPFDFAQCETHGTTFPLGGKCEWDDVKSIAGHLADKVDEQRARAAVAEVRAERAEARLADIESGTSLGRISYLRSVNHRLNRFLASSDRYGWTIEGSRSTEDCVIVRHPHRNDHFVLYPHGAGATASLQVYDGRDGYEFSPLPARTALSHIVEMRRPDDHS
jgi:hypothetical protein